MRTALLLLLWTALGCGQVPASFFAQDTSVSTRLPSAPYSGLRLWDTHTTWIDLEPSNGTFSWTTLDGFLSAAHSAGVDVMLTLGDTPAWASANPSDSQCIMANGACDPPSDLASGDNYWKAYVTAVVQHSLARKAAGQGYIQYYELWNEPGNWNAYWAGTPAQLATMAQDAYTIIHTLDPTALVVSPCPNHDAANAFLSSYFSAGGANAQDIIAFHAYAYTTAYGYDPEVTGMLQWISNIKALLASYGKASLPIWVTEGNWGHVTTLTPSQEAAWVVKYHLLLYQAGIARVYWYQWDNSVGSSSCSAVWGTMTTTATGTCPAGSAYQWLQTQLVGATPANPFCSNGGDDTWSCLFRTSAGKKAQFLWNSNTTGTQTISLDPRFTACLNFDGSACTITNHTVSVAASPVLLLMQ